MRLPDFYSTDPSQRLSLSMRKSTLDELELYRAYYVHEYGKTPALPAVIEQVLRTFMSEDKAFQKAKPKLVALPATVDPVAPLE